MYALRTTPVESLAAWRATDEVIKNESWKSWISQEHVAEFDAALKSTADKTLYDITKDDVPMPAVAQLLDQVRTDVEKGRGFAMLRGLPVERWGPEQTRRALWILGLHLGSAEPQDKAGSLIHEVKDTGVKFGENSTVRYFETNIAIPFHTDGCDALAFLCCSKGRTGGKSRLASAVTAFNEVVKRRPDLAVVLQQDFYFDARGQHPNGKQCQVHPIYTFHDGHLNIIHKFPYIESAQRLDGVPKLSDVQKEALDFLDAVMNEKDLVLEFESEPGDIQFVSNHTQVHGRTAFEDDPNDVGATRHFLRLWVTMPNGHKLPPHYVETREHMNGYVRRMPVDVSLMDGSMGRLLMNSGVPYDEDIWSGRSITQEEYHPMVIEAHKQYMESGVDMITTNNYTIVPGYYRKAFEDWETRIVKDSETAARLAVEARKQAEVKQPVRILGSLPPLSESHRPDLAEAFLAEEGEAFCIKTYRAIGEALLRGGPVDCFIAETMNNWAEAHCAIEGVKDLGKPLIVSLEGALRSNSLTPQPDMAAEIAENILAAKAAGAPIEALCFNCAPPEDIVACLKVIDHKGYRARLHAAGISLGVYPNIQDRKKVLDSAGFDVKDAKGATIRVREDLKDDGFVDHMHQFIRLGVCYIGGCCGSTPDQLGRLSNSLNLASDYSGKPKKQRRRLRADH